MPSFSSESQSRIARVVRMVERWMRNPSGHRGRWHSPRESYRIWYFELGEDLPQWSDSPVLAYRATWDKTLHSGWGGFVTDCDQPIQVADWALAGFFGKAGAYGWAEIKRCDNGQIGVIHGMVCPDECVCGEDYAETPPCTT